MGWGSALDRGPGLDRGGCAAGPGWVRCRGLGALQGTGALLGTGCAAGAGVLRGALQRWVLRGGCCVASTIVKLNAQDVARRLGGRLVLPAVADGGESAHSSVRGSDAKGSPNELVVDGLAIDSRLVQPGQMFAALSADRDGHDFVVAAFAAGAAAAVVEREASSDGQWPGPVIVVSSVPEALAELTRLARERLFEPGPSGVTSPDAGSSVSVGSGRSGSERSGSERVVGVTGSVGKTTTKDLLSNVLAQRFATVASEKSFNNELGVPLTLVNAPEGTEAAVIEMGARGPGHIRYLCELARPTIGVVTVIEGVHTEVMGSIAQIAVAKRELVEHLPSHGLAVLNAADPNVASMAGHTAASVLTFGGVVEGAARRPSISPAAASDPLGEVHAADLVLDDDLQARFDLRSPWGSVPVHLGVRGAHNVTNALAAAATGLWLGVDLESIAAGLGQAPASPWRMELVRPPGGPAVLNDAYNAGPASMEAAIRSLATLAVDEGGRRVAVLGVMAELGPEGREEHRRIAALADELGIELLAAGTDLYCTDWAVPDVASVAEELSDLGPKDAVLVKGSRVAGLERVAQDLSCRPQ